MQTYLEILKKGGIIAIPTETVYGLAADALNPDAVSKVYAVKGRPSTQPLIIHLGEQAVISDWAENIPKEAYQLMEHFWPGPLTLILPKNKKVPAIVTADQDTVALRVPNHPLTLALLNAFGSGLAAPSANRYGRISPTTAAAVKEELGEAIPVLDGGPCPVGIESTIVSCVEGCQILRPGTITQSEIEAVLGKKLNSVPNAQRTIRVPGSDLKHYAPVHPLYLLSFLELNEKLHKFRNEQKRVGIIAFDDSAAKIERNRALGSTEPQEIWITHSLDNPRVFAANLYNNLRNLDKSCDVILIETPPRTEPWLAILDRLERAAYK